jgi:hypothetical protein
LCGKRAQLSEDGTSRDTTTALRKLVGAAWDKAVAADGRRALAAENEAVAMQALPKVRRKAWLPC